MSKLALLAQKRREEAQARASPSAAAPSSPALSASATPSGASTPNAEAGPSKPLSKLAQKMAAARLAKLEAEAKAVTSPPASSDAMDIDAQGASTSGPEPATSGLFAFPKQPKKTSPFFNLLTTKCAQHTLIDAKPSTVAHLPYVPNEEELERRVRAAFGPDVESPDDIVLKARGGRAGTRGLNEAGQEEEKPTVQPKKVKAAVKEKEIVSEVGRAAKADAPTGEQAKPASRGPGSKQRKGSGSTVTLEASRHGDIGRREAGGPSAHRGGKAARGGPANPSARATNENALPAQLEQSARATPGAPRPHRARQQQKADTDLAAATKSQSAGKPRAPTRPAPPIAQPSAPSAPKLPPLPTSNDPPTPRAAREKPKAKSKQVKGPP